MCIRDRYCTFPHAIEFMNKRYEDIFPILTSYPELENYLSPFMDAWLGGAQDQLQGQIASALSLIHIYPGKIHRTAESRFPEVR